MSLDQLINEKKESDNHEKLEATGLNDLVGVKNNNVKLWKKNLCPTCGSDDTEKIEYYWRCNNSNCDVITYISPSHNTNKERW